jgi:hypothetical protein
MEARVAQLFEIYGEVEELVFDDDYYAHVRERATYQKHVVADTEILEVHQGRPAYYANAGRHRAPVLMVGPTLAGRFLVIPLEPSGLRGAWRVVTSFQANQHHVSRYQESQGN